MMQRDLGQDTLNLCCVISFVTDIFCFIFVVPDGGSEKFCSLYFLLPEHFISNLFLFALDRTIRMDLNSECCIFIKS